MLHGITIYDRASTHEYLLLPEGEQPFSFSTYEGVPLDWAARIVVNVIASHPEHPNWKLLNALNIEEHPANLSWDELAELVARALFGFPRWKLLRRLYVPGPWRPRERASVEPAQSVPAPAARLEGWIAVEVVNEKGKPAAGFLFELTLPSGDVQTVRTDEQGIARLERIQQGMCKIRVPKLDASAWKPADGAPASIVEQGPAKVHVVQQGECLVKIAQQYGILDWRRRLWEDASNESLRSKRQSPSVLHPGDRVAIPGLEITEIDRSTDASHELVVAGPSKAMVRLQLLDKEQKPFQELPCRVLADGDVVYEQTITDGKLECEVPVAAQDVRLIATYKGKQLERRLQVSYLDPASETSGVQARLANLGWFAGEVDGEPSAELSTVVREFRKKAGLKGRQLDASLFDALEREHHT